MLKIRPLSEQLALRAQEELNEKSNDVAYHINKLREWILQQPYLKARSGMLTKNLFKIPPQYVTIYKI